MTKAELIAALADLPDDGKVLVKWVVSTTDPIPQQGDLFDIGGCNVFEAMEPVAQNPAFAVIEADIAWISDDEKTRH